jgi:hypothetical protein
MTQRSESVKNISDGIFDLFAMYEDEIDAMTAVGILELIKHEIALSQSFPAIKELILNTKEKND